MAEEGESGLTLLPPFGQPGEPELKSAAEKAHVDGACGRHLFQGGAFVGGMLIE